MYLYIKSYSFLFFSSIMNPLNLHDLDHELDDAIFDFILNDPQLQATQLSFQEGQSDVCSFSSICVHSPFLYLYLLVALLKCLN